MVMGVVNVEMRVEMEIYSHNKSYSDLPIYNERGKKKLLELIDGLDDVKQNC